MHIDFLVERFKQKGEKPAIIYQEETFSYQWLIGTIENWSGVLLKNQIEPGVVVGIRSDFSPSSIGLLLSLMENGNIIVPIGLDVKEIEEYLEISEVQFYFDLTKGESPELRLKKEVTHPLMGQLANADSSGLVLFSSGSTGKPKAALHDFDLLLNKFKVERPAYRTISFLLFDHIGGVNTLLFVLSTGSTLVVPSERSPDHICRLIERYQVELLPTSPTFLNMILISGAHKTHDLSSLKLVTYGTESMPETVLSRFLSQFQGVTLKQTYGLSELGIMRTKSKGSDSLWVKIGGEDYQTKIVKGILHIKAKTAMIGYLNHPSPFSDDGWFNTQDQVEVDGEWIKILGRESDIINVGGQKVYPTEVESCVMEVENISNASVFGTKNPIVGEIVGVNVTLVAPEELSIVKKKIRSFCKDKLESFKVPIVVNIVSGSMASDRFKKVR